MTSNPQQSVEERVARHLAAKDWLVEPGSAWARRGKKFHEDYLAAAREVIAIVREGAASPVGQPARAGAALRDRIAETLTTTLSRMDVMAWLGCRRGDRDHDVSITQTELGRTLAAEVLAVFPEPPSRAADDLAKHVTRAIFALKTPTPPGSEHYRSGWDDGLEAAIDAARGEVLRWLAAEAQPETEEQPETPLEKRLRYSERRNDELRAECKRRGKIHVKYAEKIERLEKQLDEVRTQLGAEILRAGQAEDELRRSSPEAQQQPDTEAGPWVVHKICCGHDDGKAEFTTWEAADSFREVYIDSARIADHERSAIIRRSDAPAPVEPAAADSEETRS